MSKYNWSTTAADNDDADSAINWRENQAPSTVNNSARAMMAAEAKDMADTRKPITATGSSNAYAITTTTAPGSYVDGLQVLVMPNHDNTGAATLNVDSLGAKALRVVSGTSLPAGAIVTNRPFTARYRTSSDEFLIDAGVSAEGVQFNWQKGADVASATTLTLGTDGNSFDITGTTAIEAISSLGVGTIVLLQFDDALTLTHHSTDLVLPGSADITTAAGDTALFWEYASGDWRCLVYTRSTGIGLTQSQYAASKLYTYNSGFRISQENGTSSGTASGYYPVDQWTVIHSQDGTLTSQQVASATPGGSPNRLRLTVTSADASLAAGQYAYIEQPMEGYRTADLLFGTASAVDVVIRFGWKSPAGTYAVAIVNQDNNRSFVREFTISGGEANTDTLQTVTVPGDTSGTWDADNTKSFSLRFCIATGSTFHTTAGSWQAGEYFGTSSTSNGIGTGSAVFELFDVGLYADQDSLGLAPRFELPHYDSDLRECQRYFENGQYYTYIGYVTTGVTYGEYAEFKVNKRANPSISQINLGASNLSSTPVSDAVSVFGFRTSRVATATTTGAIFNETWAANARL